MKKITLSISTLVFLSYSIMSFGATTPTNTNDLVKQNIYGKGAQHAMRLLPKIVESHLDAQRVCTGWLNTLLNQPRPANISQDDESYKVGIRAEQEDMTLDPTYIAGGDKPYYARYHTQFCQGFVDFNKYYVTQILPKQHGHSPSRPKLSDFFNFCDSSKNC